jgi:hypothetical protein
MIASLRGTRGLRRQLLLISTVMIIGVVWMWRVEDILPKMTTTTTTTTMAMMPFLDSVMEPESVPAAPASESPVPAVDPTSPADGPVH